MRIKHHVQKTFETADAYAGVDSVEKRLIDNSFLVVLDEGSFIGFLTPIDIIESPNKLNYNYLIMLQFGYAQVYPFG